MPYFKTLFIWLIITAFLLSFLSLFVTSGEFLILQNPKSIDFLAFYMGAKLFVEDPSQLYNFSEQLRLQYDILPITKPLHIFLPYLNPPFVVLFFLPFIGLPFLLAYNMWLFFNVGIIISLCYFIFRKTQAWPPRFRIGFLIAFITFIPLLTSLMIGQLSILLCLILFVSWFLLQKEKPFYSGLVISLLFIKPHFFIVPFFAFLIERNMKMVSGLISGIVFLLVISFLMVGWSGILSYLDLMLNAVDWSALGKAELYAQHSIQTVLLILFPALDGELIRVLWIILSVPFVLMTLFVWRKSYPVNSKQTTLKWSLLLIITLFTTPHTHFHDLTVLLFVSYILFTSFQKFGKTTRKKYTILLISLYLLELIGYIAGVETNAKSSHAWIISNVVFLIIFSVIIMHDLLHPKSKL